MVVLVVVVKAIVICIQQTISIGAPLCVKAGQLKLVTGTVRVAMGVLELHTDQHSYYLQLAIPS